MLLRAILKLPAVFSCTRTCTWQRSCTDRSGCCVVVQGLRKLSLYDVASGDTVSRGALGFDASALADGIEPGALPVT